MITPVDIEALQQLLIETEYDQKETAFLLEGFRNGFPIGYQGDRKVKLTSPNLKFRGVGNHTILWNKIMKEVKLKWYAGPYESIPFEFYIQSPVGLVPKDRDDVRLIFHLSYPRNTGKSVNENTPPGLCSVSYPDFAEAIMICVEEGVNCNISHSDMRSAFHNLGIWLADWFLLIMKAVSPLDGKTYYFIDKCLPFGAAISCSHFQRFSNSVAHIVSKKTGKKLVNYLDDYLFIQALRLLCNLQVKQFLEICRIINFPVSMEKIFWVTNHLTFLGFLIDTLNQVVCIPDDKILRALSLIREVINKDSKKVTLKQLQKLYGFLNFLCHCVIPGWPFTRRLYAYTAGNLTPPSYQGKRRDEMRPRNVDGFLARWVGVLPTFH